MSKHEEELTERVETMSPQTYLPYSPYPRPAPSVHSDEDSASFIDIEPERPGPLCCIAIRTANRLEVNEETLRVLQTRFKDCKSLSPFLVIGHPQSGKSALLDAILEDEVHFRNLPDEEGLYIWPKPVQRGSKSLLLMEMSGIYFAHSSEATLKLAAIAQALSAVCGICLEKASFFDNLSTLIGLCDCSNCQFIHPPQKFLIFTHSEPQSKGRRNSRYMECRNKYSSKHCLFLERDSKCPSGPLISSILTEITAFTKDFPQIEVPEKCAIIGKFAYFAHLAAKIANMTSSLLDFVSQFDNLKQLEECHPSQLKQVKKWRESVQSSASLELLQCNTSGVSVQSSTVGVLVKNFDRERDMVVVTVLGDPGIGKSTLLNCLIQHVASLSQCHAVFQPSRGSAEHCRVLSCPIWLGPARDLQCMLLDLGSGHRTETAVLALASVVCLVITNELSSLERVGKRVELLGELQKYYGYCVNCILLLFHDKEIEASPNPVWETAILDLEKQYFEGKSVFKILNKPNFLSGDILQKQRFLDIFLSECSTNRCQIQSSSLFSKLQDISKISHSLEPLDTLIFTPQEQKEYCIKANHHYNKLEDTQILQTQSGRDLYSAFVEFLEGLKANTRNMPCSVAVRRRMVSELDTHSHKHRFYTLQIDAFHYQTEYIPPASVSSLMESFQKQAISSNFNYKWWTIKENIVQGYDYLNHIVVKCSLHFPAEKEKYTFILDAVCMSLEEVRKSTVAGLVSVGGKMDCLRGAVYMEIPCADTIIVVVGGLERVLFCDKLVEVIQPFTFPGFKTFTEGNQTFTVNYSISRRTCTCSVVSLELCSVNLFRDSGELLSRADIVYFLLDYPKKMHELAPLDAADIMLRSYKPLYAFEASQKKVVFLSNNAEKLANCRQLAIHYLDADFRLVTVEEGSAQMMELLYEVPRLLGNLE